MDHEEPDSRDTVGVGCALEKEGRGVRRRPWTFLRAGARKSLRRCRQTRPERAYVHPLFHRVRPASRDSRAWQTGGRWFSCSAGVVLPSSFPKRNC